MYSFYYKVFLTPLECQFTIYAGMVHIHNVLYFLFQQLWKEKFLSLWVCSHAVFCGAVQVHLKEIIFVECDAEG